MTITTNNRFCAEASAINHALTRTNPTVMGFKAFSKRARNGLALNFSQNLSSKQSEINTVARVALKNEYNSFYKTLDNKRFQIIKLYNLRNFLNNFKFQKIGRAHV